MRLINQQGPILAKLSDSSLCGLKSLKPNRGTL